mmetsp:Transcript_1469/g.1653  ORF Transcript_1469/g.1653 Transcript_1469/m.1653 type:complete len:390 (-) Transcript_1469:94-1263(-)
MSARYHPYNDRNTHYDNSRRQWDGNKRNSGSRPQGNSYSGHRSNSGQSHYGPYRNSPSFNGHAKNYHSHSGDNQGRPSSHFAHSQSYQHKSGHYQSYGDRNNYGRHRYANSSPKGGYSNSRDNSAHNLSTSSGSASRAPVKKLKRPKVTLDGLLPESITPAMKELHRILSRSSDQINRCEDELLSLHRKKIDTDQELHRVNLKLLDQDLETSIALQNYEQICEDRRQLLLQTEALENSKVLPDPSWHYEKKPTTLPDLPDPPPRPAQPKESSGKSLLESSSSPANREYFREKEEERKYRDGRSRDRDSRERDRDYKDRESRDRRDYDRSDRDRRDYDRGYDSRSRGSDRGYRDRDRDRYDKRDDYRRDSKDYSRDRDSRRSSRDRYRDS